MGSAGVVQNVAVCPVSTASQGKHVTSVLWNQHQLSGLNLRGEILALSEVSGIDTDLRGRTGQNFSLAVGFQSQSLKWHEACLPNRVHF